MIPFDLTEFGADIPEVPNEIQNMITDLGGSTNGFPNARLVRGTDPTLQVWCGKGWVPKYTLPEVDVVEFAILHQPNGQKKTLSLKEAEVFQNSKKLKGIITYSKQVSVKDNLIPRYFMEVYRPPEFFGNKESWDATRIGVSDEGEEVDFLGDFPENGDYETWFCIEDFETNLAGKPVLSKFRPIDDEVIQFIQEQIAEAKIKTRVEQHLENIRNQQEQERLDREARLSDLKDKIRDRIDRIVQTPSNIRRK